MQGKKWSTPERDERIIELYAQYESAIKVAEMVGCGRTTVNNILVKYGIPRIGRSHGPTYPSIDHIVPRAKGGEHKWSNVQLAHCICNSRKRDLMGDELQEVMLNAS